MKMKSNFSTSWVSSKLPRKQRNYRNNAPLHIKHKFLNANLSKELRKKYGKRSLPLRKGDEVIVMRGNFSKKNGKVVEIDLRRSRLTIDGLTRKKIDGVKISVYFDPSNLQIQTLNIEDSKRLNINKKEIKNNAPDKKPNN